MATTVDRQESENLTGHAREFGVTANTLYVGNTMAALDTATSLCVPGAASTTLVAVGVVERRVNNLTGALGPIDKTVRLVYSGIYKFNNSAPGADEIALDDIGKDFFVVDNDTVALTNGGATRSRGGTIWNVLSTGEVLCKFDG